MEILVIALLIGYALFKDILFYKEREKLQLKLMSRGVGEYVESIAPVKEEDTPQEEDPYIPVEDATYNQILNSRDVV